LKADILQAEPGQLIVRPRPVRHVISSYAFHPLAPEFNVDGGCRWRTCEINSTRASPWTPKTQTTTTLNSGRGAQATNWSGEMLPRLTCRISAFTSPPC